MFTIEILRGARTLLADRNHWTKGENARMQDGTPVTPIDLAACCWCAGGAIMKATNDDFALNTRAFDLLSEAACELNYSRANDGDQAEFVNFNDADDTDHAQMLALFDRAIELAGAR